MAPFDQQQFEVEAPVIVDPVIDVLEQAKARISTPDKWCKNVLYDEQGARCILGALQATSDCPGDEMWHSHFLPAFRLINAFVPTGNMVDFNNDPATTHADILTLFDRAIAARKAELA